MAPSTGQRQLQEDAELRRLVEHFLDGVGRLQSLPQFGSNGSQRPQIDELAAMAGEIQTRIPSFATDTDDRPRVNRPPPTASVNGASRPLGADGLIQRRLSPIPATTSSTTCQGSPTAGGQRQRQLQQPMTTAPSVSHVSVPIALRRQHHRQPVAVVEPILSRHRREASATVKEMLPRGGMIYEPGRYLLNSRADENRLQCSIHNGSALEFKDLLTCDDVDSRLAWMFREATELTVHVNPRDNFPSVTVRYHDQPFPIQARYDWQDHMPDRILQTTMSRLVQARYRAIESSKNIQQDFPHEGFLVRVIDSSLGDQTRKRPTLWSGHYVLARELGLTGRPQQMGEFDRLDKDRARHPRHDSR